MKFMGYDENSSTEKLNNHQKRISFSQISKIFKPRSDLCLYLLIAILIIFATVASPLVHFRIFDGLPHLEDEMAYIYQAKIFAHGDFYVKTPEPAYAYWQPFVIDCNQQLEEKFNISCEGKRFGKYPPGWPLLLSLGFIINAPWLINAIFSGLTIFMVYKLTQEIYDKKAGLIAALLMALSPIALLLNGTFMGHTSSQFFVLLFIFGFWRADQNRHKNLWAAIAGIALGIVIAIRPLTALGIAIPFMIYCLFRVVIPFFRESSKFFMFSKNYLFIILFTFIAASIWPTYNYISTGNPFTNTYRLIWEFDQYGFGSNHGPAEHSLKIGINNLKLDWKCFSRDLFGWTLPGDTPPSKPEYPFNECMVDKPGISWIPIVFSFFFIRSMDWRTYLSIKKGEGLKGDFYDKSPIDLWKNPAKWSLLIFASSICLILIHVGYWVGARVYSARYYFESAAGLAILAGAGFSALANEFKRLKALYPFYFLLCLILIRASLIYTPHRLLGLQQFGCISQQQIQQVKSLRYTPQTPVLVIVSGEQKTCYKDHPDWRDIGPLLSVTDPFFKNEIIVVNDKYQNQSQNFMKKYPERQVIMMIHGEFKQLNIKGRAGYFDKDNNPDQHY